MPDDNQIVVETCSLVNHNKRSNFSCWWESSTFLNLVPKSDTQLSITSRQIKWSKSLKVSDLMQSRSHLKQDFEHIQGFIETKVPKSHYLWTNTIRYRAIWCGNTAKTWRKLFCMMPNWAEKFIVNNKYMMLCALVVPINPRHLNVMSTDTRIG